MEGAPFNRSSESSLNSGGTGEEEKKLGKKPRGKKAVKVLANAEKAEKVAEKAKRIEKVAKAPTIEQLLKGKTPIEDGSVRTEADTEKSVDLSREVSVNNLASAEETVADDLARGVTIHHDALEQIPESREDAVATRAVESLYRPPTADLAELTAERSIVPEESIENTAEAEAEESVDTVEGSERFTGKPEADTDEVEDDSMSPVTPVTAASRTSSTAYQSSPNLAPTSSPIPAAATLMPPSPPAVRSVPTYNVSGSSSVSSMTPNIHPNIASTNMAPGTPNVTGVTHNAESAAFRRGRSRGLIAGLVVGGGIEHIRHKRRERRMERKFAAERKETERKLVDQHWNQVREAESSKIQEATAEKYRATDRLVAPTPLERDSRANQTRTSTEVLRQRAEIQTEIEKKLAAERAEEKRKETNRVITKTEEIEQDRQREQLELAEGHRMERSAWHNIEVDSHGKTVQETSFEYGHEYYQERGHETGPRTMQVKHHLDEAAGEIAIVATALNSDTRPTTNEQKVLASPQQHEGTSGSARVPQPASLPRHTPLLVQPKLHSPKSLVKTLTSPPTTPAGTLGWFIALVAIAIIYLVLLR